MDLEWNDGEAVAGNRVTDLVHDLGDGDELVGAVGEALSALNDGIGIDDSDGYALGRLAAFDEYLAGGVWVWVLGLWLLRFLLHDAAPTRD